MESPQDQEFISSSNDLSQIVKGKRTKRHRSSSPEKPPPLPSTTTATVASTSSSGCCVVAVAGGGDRNNSNNSNAVSEEYYGSISSPTTSSEVYPSTEEEEDMAYCLILLAQGDGKSQPPKNHHRRRRINGDESCCGGGEKISARKVFEVSSERTINKAGFLVYECKTCNRSFPSFQALGGHRASHKKPKSAAPDQEKKLLSAPVLTPEHHDLDFDSQLNKVQVDDDDHHQQVQERPFCLQLSAIKANKSSSSSKIHECSICGSEFTSGQALGGHMRRHRASNGNNSNNNLNNPVMISTIDHDQELKPRNLLSLDLNLPAPEDDHQHRESNFQFVSTQQALVFSAPALVDCYY